MPCGDGCNTPNRELTAAEHEREAKRLRARDKARKEGLKRAAMFVDRLKGILAAYPNTKSTWIIVHVEEDRVHPEIAKIPWGKKGVIENFTEWIKDCNPVPDEMLFVVDEALGYTWVRAYHTHKRRR